MVRRRPRVQTGTEVILGYGQLSQVLSSIHGCLTISHQVGIGKIDKAISQKGQCHVIHTPTTKKTWSES